ncbi:MAG: hypothetical protein KKD05_00235 [Candidatus Omnitrophica bacterium]|nr:hypothetical protein [Candidatus Omnitrophota bacterium]
MSFINEQRKVIDINYEFKFEDGKAKTFNVQLDDQSLCLVNAQNILEKQDWALMANFRCENCSLDTDEHKYCPLALILHSLLVSFKSIVSCDRVDLKIVTSRRTYFKNDSVQAALSSLMGIYMVTSGCPVFDKLKPMVRYHLPFASHEETAYRIISMYLFAQFFRKKWGEEPDWDFKKLLELFEDIKTTNRNVAFKFNKLVEKDALLNAVVRLNANVDFISLCFDETILAQIERDFAPYK